MHIPKTSGTAVTSGLATALGVSAVVGFDHSIFGLFEEFDTFDASLQERIYASPACLPAGAAFVAGHIALSTLRKAYPRAPLLTILREPASRLLSHWLYWRQFTDAMLASLGAWADRVRYARLPLATFLQQPSVACQTDNLTLRMLLWPHPLIPADGFIDPANGEPLVREAMARLQDFDFLDFLENDNLGRNLQRWIGAPFVHGRLNETRKVPDQFSGSLHRELTREALELLRLRSRLDLRLWVALAGRRMRGGDIAGFREQILHTNMARYADLLSAGGQTG